MDESCERKKIVLKTKLKKMIDASTFLWLNADQVNIFQFYKAI